MFCHVLPRFCPSLALGTHSIRCGVSQHLAIDLNPNINFITGDNGSGKSSILIGIQVPPLLPASPLLLANSSNIFCSSVASSLRCCVCTLLTDVLRLQCG